MNKDRFEIRNLGPANLSSPLPLSNRDGDKLFNFISDADRVVFNTAIKDFSRCVQSGDAPLSVEKAGPREKIFFDPRKTTAAIVTCGGLCPGINNVIRSLVMGLHYFYGVPKIIGIPYGYQG